MILIFFVSHLGPPVLEPFWGGDGHRPFLYSLLCSPFFCLEVCYQRRK